MKIVTSILMYIGIIICVIQNWLLVAAALVLLFSLRHGAAALIVAAILIDGYFGNFYTTPYLSLFSVVWYIFAAFARTKIVNLKFV